MNNLNPNLINGGIYHIVEFFMLNSESIDFEKSQEEFKNKFYLLDNSAIFLRIMNKNLENEFLEKYKKIHTQIGKDREEENNIINEIKNLEKKINDILDLDNDESDNSPKVLGLNSLLLMGQEVKTIFLNDEVNIKSLESFKEFHTALLSNHGRYLGKPNEKNMKVKSGYMFQYYKLTDLLLSKTNKLILKVQEYEDNAKIKEELRQNLYSISNKIVSDLDNLTDLDNELLKNIIEDVNNFIGNTKCKEN